MKGGGRNMVNTPEKWSMSEIQVIVRFLHAKGNPSTKIHRELAPSYGYASDGVSSIQGVKILIIPTAVAISVLRLRAMCCRS